jgi:chloramphenicol-sensitive protein RarD
VSDEEASEARRGLVYGVAAYGLWGIVPVFWKLLAHVDPVEVLAHRVVWGMLTFLVIVRLAGAGAGARLRAALADRRILATMALSGAALAINWGVFIYSVTYERLLEASLGYFINPLLSVALGTIVLRERMRSLQWCAIACALGGVALLTWQAGSLPWIAVLLAGSFGVYGLLRKLASVDSLVGSTLESMLMAPLALALLGTLALRGEGELGHAGLADHALLVATGIVTAGPLLLFTSAARRLPLSTVGFLQYLAPTGQFLLAIAVYDEPFASDELAAFALIWLGLIVFSIDLRRTALRRVEPSAGPGAPKAGGPSSERH